MSNNLSYGRFDMTVFLRGTFMFDLLNIMDLVYTNRARYSNNFLQKGLDIPISSYAYSNYFIEKGDFVKLDNLTMGYTINTGKIKYLKKQGYMHRDKTCSHSPSFREETRIYK